jgi:hypothetical protein
MALPVPARLHDIEILRDGGSLAASFSDADGAYFHLRLPVIRTDGTFTPCGYAAPELERTVPHLYTDKFTGGQHGYETSETITLSWEDGEHLLARLAPLPVERKARTDGEFLGLMARILAARGAIPATP